VSNGAVSIANSLILWDFDIRQLHSVLVHLGILGRRMLAGRQKRDEPRSTNAFFQAVSRH
jgi:hypothetical protein